jgi:hypothetical protein
MEAEKIHEEERLQCGGSRSEFRCFFTPWIRDEFVTDPGSRRTGSGLFFGEIFLHYLQIPACVIFFKLGYSLKLTTDTVNSKKKVR